MQKYFKNLFNFLLFLPKINCTFVEELKTIKMIKSSIELIAENIGFDIAHSDDHTQANLLNGLGRGFKLYRQQDFQMQLSYISGKLSVDAEKVILELAEFIKLKNT
jgi:hypothetical protein